MTAIDDWKGYLDVTGISWTSLESNNNAIQLTGMAGAPILRAVETREQLDSLHTTARQKSSELERLLILALPFDHPHTQMTLPGDIVLPKVRAYAGHISDTYSLSGHLIQSKFLTSIKKEVSRVITDGPKVSTPLCDWALKLLGRSWVYGTPSSASQLDSMLGLLAKDPAMIGHVRSRQLTYGRGCADAVLLPIKGVQLSTNKLDQKIEQCDMRFVSLEAEMSMYDSSRARIHAVMSNHYLTCASQSNQTFASQLGCDSMIGISKIGTTHTKERHDTGCNAFADKRHALVES
ncbi:hypothetical protein [Synechococcus sp. WH 8016]|uniref:hypothetical protein n=1 Tax=Synechococcus sp. WH 8016 TaxID=166318 RepID=UPI00022D7D90|nr:hypothetical protein [Synechococcus sp. WH 8016]EHA63796.1 hypothetical protein Syn8016DRAFT_0837 [Synechococcus sp. WH 8016]